MKRNIATALGLLLLSALPLSSFAATYGYINIEGNFVTETAANATQALNQPTDIDPHSGVLLIRSSVVQNISTSPIMVQISPLNSIPITVSTTTTSSSTIPTQISSSTTPTATTSQSSTARMMME